MLSRQRDDHSPSPACGEGKGDDGNVANPCNEASVDHSPRPPAGENK